MQLNIEESLVSFGLTPNQVKLYLFFLHEGELLAAEAARRLKLDKSSAYRAVDQLVEQGLLVVNPRKRGSTYLAANPEILEHLADQRLAQLTRQKDQIGGLIEKLKQETHSRQRKTYIKVETGSAAYYQMMEASLRSEEKLIREKFPFSSRVYSGNENHLAYLQDYIKRRVARKINIRQLYDRTSAKVGSPVMKNDQAMLKEVRLLPEDVEEENFFRIYDDTVVIISRDEANDFIVMTLQDKFVAGLMKSLFDFIWNRSQEYLPR